LRSHALPVYWFFCEKLPVAADTIVHHSAAQAAVENPGGKPPGHSKHVGPCGEWWATARCGSNDTPLFNCNAALDNQEFYPLQARTERASLIATDQTLHLGRWTEGILCYKMPLLLLIDMWRLVETTK